MDFGSPAFAYRIRTGPAIQTVALSLRQFREGDQILMKNRNFKDYGGGIKPYSRRKGMAVDLAVRNVSITQTRVLMRHSIGTLKHYITLGPETKTRLQRLVLTTHPVRMCLSFSELDNIEKLEEVQTSFSDKNHFLPQTPHSKKGRNAKQKSQQNQNKRRKLSRANTGCAPHPRFLNSMKLGAEVFNSRFCSSSSFSASHWEKNLPSLSR